MDVSKLDSKDEGLSRMLPDDFLPGQYDPLLALFNCIEMSVARACGEPATFRFNAV